MSLSSDVHNHTSATLPWRDTELEVGELTMCTVVSFDPDTDIYTVTLDEYGDITGQLMAKDVAAKVKHGIASLQNGTKLPLSITEIEQRRDQTIIMLSKKDVAKADCERYKEYYSLTLRLFNLVRRLGHMGELTETSWHEQFAGLLSHYLNELVEDELEPGERLERHPYNLLAGHEDTELDEEYIALIERKHIELFGLQAQNQRVRFVALLYTIYGHEELKNILLAAIAPYKAAEFYSALQLSENTDLCNVTLLPSALPTFELHVQSYTKEHAAEVTERIVSEIRDKIAAKSGYFELRTIKAQGGEACTEERSKAKRK